MDAAEYKHVVLGLVFLKYISDTFEEHRAKLLASKGEYAHVAAEAPDEYNAENVCWESTETPWKPARARGTSANQSTVGKNVCEAMVAIERDDPRINGVLNENYARPGLDEQRLGELIALTAPVKLTAASEGEKTCCFVELLGRGYEHFLTRLASAEGINGGQLYAPFCIVRRLVEILDVMNLALRGIEADLNPRHADTFPRRPPS